MNGWDCGLSPDPELPQQPQRSQGLREVTRWVVLEVAFVLESQPQGMH